MMVTRSVLACKISEGVNRGCCVCGAKAVWATFGAGGEICFCETHFKKGHKPADEEAERVMGGKG